ncbi:MAG: cyclase family protein [Gammaproteobacteria bacterium]
MIIKRHTYKDLTAAITSKTVVFPGDPTFEARQVSSIGGKSFFNLSEMRMCNHMETHIDFPAHVLKQGKTSSDYSIQDIIGDGIILELPLTKKTISKSFVDKQNILENDFVFFKTSNSNLSKHENLSDSYVYIEPDAAIALLEKKCVL